MPGEPRGPDIRNSPATGIRPPPTTKPKRSITLQGHRRYVLVVAALLLLLGWLTFDGAHPNIVLLIYVAALAAAYRLVANERVLSRKTSESLTFTVLSLGLLGLLGILSGWSTTYLVFIFTTIAIYSLFALGLNLEFGYTGILNFGHVAFMGIGAYTMALLAAPLLGRADAFTGTGGAGLVAFVATAVVAFLILGVLVSVFAEILPSMRRTPPEKRRRIIILSGITGGVLGVLLVLILVPYPMPPMWAATTVVFGSAVAGMILAGIAGVILGLPALRLRADYLAIVTIGAAEILRRFWRNEGWLTGGPIGVTSMPRPFAEARREWDWLQALAGWLDITDPNRLLLFLMSGGLLLLTMALFWILVHSPYGRVLRAIREDEDVARALGKNVFLYKLQVLAVGSMVAAVAGALLAWQNLFISPETFIPIITFYAWVIIVVGGVGNNKGAILGAIVLWTFFEATRSLNLAENLGLAGPQAAALRVVIIGVLLMLLMLFKPEGILGRKEEMVLGD